MTNVVKTSECDWMRNDYYTASAVVIGGISFPTIEHAYQAAKTTNTDKKREISLCWFTKEARQLGRKIELDIDDWEMKRCDVMETLILKKFLSNDDLKDRLIKTNDDEIIADYNDSYWGIGSDNNGDNILGKILEHVRSQLQIMEGYSFKTTNIQESYPTLEEALENSDEKLRSSVQSLFDKVKLLVKTVSDLECVFVDIDDDDGNIESCVDANYDCKSLINDIETILKTPVDSEEEEEEEEEEEDW
jgi:hypothetical protein